MDFIIITGMSGAGKTIAVNAMEDLSYFCVDNLPVQLTENFYDLSSQANLKKVSVVIDIRNSELTNNFANILTALKENKSKYKLLFLDANDNVLINRYKETRRRHPLLEEAGGSIEEAIKNERAYLSDIKVNADIVIDTSLLSARQLKSRITEEFSNGNSKSMSITCVSFGFKYGLPTDADLVFDARCLPNPFYIDELKNLTGLSEPVKSFLEEKTEWKSWADNLFSFIDYSIPLYMAEGKSNLVIAVGCTGGKHRSVATAQMLYEHLKDTCERVVVSHRDISKL